MNKYNSEWLKAHWIDSLVGMVMDDKYIAEQDWERFL